jgi:hypothetical protein
MALHILVCYLNIQQKMQSNFHQEKFWGIIQLELFPRISPDGNWIDLII